MTFDPAGPVLAILIEPGDETANLQLITANLPRTIETTIGGPIQAIDIDGGSVLWMDESGKNKKLPTNLLATKIAHRLNAGLYPDDTINGRALILGELAGPTGDLVSANVSTETLARIQAVGVEIREA